MFKAGYVSVVGKPNAGKSTLINKIVGYKVAITAPKPQTTRFNVKGIATSETSQIVFLDTPGIHNPKNKMGEYMMNGVSNAVKGTNTIVYLLDATKPRIDDVTIKIIEDIAKINLKSKKKVIMCINKIDKIEKSKLLEIIANYSNLAKEKGLEFCDIIPISVFKNDGLDTLILSIENTLDESEMLFDEDEITDITEREIVSENIREILLKNYEEEIPHGVNAEVESFKERTNVNGDLTYDINVAIICQRKAHKPIIIGEGGKKIRHITNLSKRELERVLDVKVNLKIYVKVKEDWLNNEAFLKEIKFRNEQK